MDKVDNLNNVAEVYLKCSDDVDKVSMVYKYIIFMCCEEIIYYSYVSWIKKGIFLSVEKIKVDKVFFQDRISKLLSSGEKYLQMIYFSIA